MLTISPKTHGVFTVTLTELVSNVAAPIPSATVTATVFSPAGRVVTANVAMSPLGSGQWSLALEPAWSTSGTRGVEGLYAIEVKAVVGSDTFTERFPVTMSW